MQKVHDKHDTQDGHRSDKNNPEIDSSILLELRLNIAAPQKKYNK